jgi:hypothetical protein
MNDTGNINIIDCGLMTLSNSFYYYMFDKFSDMVFARIA